MHLHQIISETILPSLPLVFTLLPEVYIRLPFDLQVLSKEIQFRFSLMGGSTHNFIHPRVARKLKLPIEPASEFSVMVGNVQTLRCLGVIHVVCITIQGYSFSTTFFVIDLHNLDLVLGVYWLATLWPSLSDYIKCTFEFTISGQHIRWVGDPISSLAQINVSILRRFSQTNSISYVLRLDLHSTNTTYLSEYPLTCLHSLSLTLMFFSHLHHFLHPDPKTIIYHFYQELAQLMYAHIATPIFRRQKLSARYPKCSERVSFAPALVLIHPMFYWFERNMAHGDFV